MKLLDIESADLDLIEDFCNDFREQYEHCEEALITLENTPSDIETLRDLFRTIHTVKGNLIYIGLKGLTPLLQSVEDVLEKVRGQEMPYDDLLSDVILLALDTTKALVDENLHQAPSRLTEERFDQICQHIQAIANSSEQTRKPATLKAIKLLDPHAPITLLPPATQAFPHDQLLQQAQQFGVELHPDILFINNLVPALDSRLGLANGDTQRVAMLALLMNQRANTPADPTQLFMAALAHDIAMPFLPLNLLEKSSALTPAERTQLNCHVEQAVYLLSGLGHWEGALAMIAQHHERADGSGYPKGLQLGDICIGARILAITDTFNACRRGRNYRPLTERRLIRSILEINRHAGRLFDDEWVNIFNDVAREFLHAHPD